MIWFIIGIASSLVAAILWAVFLRRWPKIIIYFRLKSLRKLWSQFFQGQTTVVMTGRPGPLSRSTTRTSFSEVKALVVLIDFFRHNGANLLITNSIEAPPETLKNQNIIILGGKGSNEFTKYISSSIAIPFGYDDKGNLTSHFGTFATSPSDGNSIKSDYALIVKCSNLLDGDGKVFLLSGNHGAATEAAAKYVTTREGIADIAERIRDEDFIAILKVDIKDNVPHAYYLEHCWRFENINQNKGKLA